MAIQEERKPRLRGQRNGTTARQRDLIQKRQGDITGQQGIMDFFFLALGDAKEGFALGPFFPQTLQNRD